MEVGCDTPFGALGGLPLGFAGLNMLHFAFPMLLPLSRVDLCACHGTAAGASGSLGAVSLAER